MKIFIYNNYFLIIQACIKDGTCACFTALPAFDKDMCNMTTTYDSAKTSKTGCNSPKEAGSFGECSKNQKMAGQFVGKCTEIRPISKIAQGVYFQTIYPAI